MKANNLKGMRIGKFLVLRRISNTSDNKALWLVLCTGCGKKIPVRAAHLRQAQKHGENVSCKPCSKTKHGFSGSAEYEMWCGAKSRARKQKIPFSIEVSDIYIPQTCPLLGIAIMRTPHTHSGNSPSLDRINPVQGYVKGNVWVVSYLANAIKHNATLDQLQTLTRNLYDKTTLLWVRDDLFARLDQIHHIVPYSEVEAIAPAIEAYHE